MKCPVCKEAMIILELDQVEIDYCPSCSGIWLDEGELELLLEGGEARNSLLQSLTAVSASKEKTRKCPRCRKKMDKVSGGTDSSLLIDKCSRQHGIWFDAGELQEMIRQGGLGQDSRIPQLLSEMFRHKLQ